MITTKNIFNFFKVWTALYEEKEVATYDVFEDDDGIGFSFVVDNRFIVELQRNGTWSIIDKRMS